MSNKVILLKGFSSVDHLWLFGLRVIWMLVGVILILCRNILLRCFFNRRSKTKNFTRINA